MLDIKKWTNNDLTLQKYCFVYVKLSKCQCTFHIDLGVFNKTFLIAKVCLHQLQCNLNNPACVCQLCQKDFLLHCFPGAPQLHPGLSAARRNDNSCKEIFTNQSNVEVVHTDHSWVLTHRFLSSLLPSSALFFFAVLSHTIFTVSRRKCRGPRAHWHPAPLSDVWHALRGGGEVSLLPMFGRHIKHIYRTP